MSSSSSSGQNGTLFLSPPATHEQDKKAAKSEKAAKNGAPFGGAGSELAKKLAASRQIASRPKQSQGASQCAQEHASSPHLGAEFALPAGRNNAGH